MMVGGAATYQPGATMGKLRTLGRIALAILDATQGRRYNPRDQTKAYCRGFDAGRELGFQEAARASPTAAEDPEAFKDEAELLAAFREAHLEEPAALTDERETVEVPSE